MLETLYENDPKHASILFSLDELKIPRSFLSELYVGPTSYTEQEISFILANPKYFAIARWFDRGRELSRAEVRRRFEPYAPWLYNRAIAPPRPIFKWHVRDEAQPLTREMFERYEGQLFRVD